MRHGLPVFSLDHYGGERTNGQMPGEKHSSTVKDEEVEQRRKRQRCSPGF